MPSSLAAGGKSGVLVVAMNHPDFGFDHSTPSTYSIYQPTSSEFTAHTFQKSLHPPQNVFIIQHLILGKPSHIQETYKMWEVGGS
jgi:hypothetical protein